eukprot:7214566-Pyramimonas_sp.AAC.1
MRSAEAELDAQGAKEGPIDWGSYLAEPRAKLQGHWGKRISAHRRTQLLNTCLLYTSPSPRDRSLS